jgi:hypothetical protein
MFEKYHCFGMYKMSYFNFYPLITVKVKATTNLLTNEWTWDGLGGWVVKFMTSDKTCLTDMGVICWLLTRLVWLTWVWFVDFWQDLSDWHGCGLLTSDKTCLDWHGVCGEGEGYPHSQQFFIYMGTDYQIYMERKTQTDVTYWSVKTLSIV